MGSSIGLKEAIAMGVGAMVGGGIFAVLGLAINLAGRAVIVTYSIAGLIALASGYSYIKLTETVNSEGGSFVFLEHFVDRYMLASFLGWVLVLGYIGSMAMYAYTFGAFFTGFLENFVDTPPFTQSAISAIILLIFLGINLQGTGSSTSSEVYLVASKVLVLLIISFVGIVGLLNPSNSVSLPAEFFNQGYLSPFLAVGVIFVSYQGFQLLTYEYNQMEDPKRTISWGIMLSIIISTIIYLLISFVTSSLLSPQLILEKKETVLAYVLYEFFKISWLRSLSFYIVVLAALASTASAINATLFGTAMLSSKMADEGTLPPIFSFRDKSSVPTNSLWLITGLTLLLVLIGSLEEISAFASLSFLIIFSVVNLLLVTQDIETSRSSIGLFGLVGSLLAVLTYLYYAIQHRPSDLAFIIIIFLITAGLNYWFQKEYTSGST